MPPCHPMPPFFTNYSYKFKFSEKVVKKGGKGWEEGGEEGVIIAIHIHISQTNIHISPPLVIIIVIHIHIITNENHLKNI